MDRYKEIFKDVYNYMSKYVPEPRDYDKLIEDGERIAEKYKGTGQHEFVTRIMIAVWGELKSS